MKKVLRKSVFVISLLVIIIGALGIFYLSMENGSIQTDYFYVSPKISGEIVELNVENNQTVKEGEILAKINQDEFNKSLLTAKERLEKAKKEYKISSQIIEKIKADLLAGEDNIENVKTQLENASSDYIRYKNAHEDGSVTKKDLNNAIENLQIAKEKFNLAQDNLEKTNKNLETFIYNKNTKNNEIKNILSEIKQAELNLSYTTLVSPKEGIVVNKKVNIKDYVQNGQNILTIASKNYFIDVEIKENKIAKIKKGKNAFVIVNKCKFYTAKIESIENNHAKLIFNNNISNLNTILNKKVKVKF